MLAVANKGQLYISSPDPSHLNMAIASMCYLSGTCSLLFTESRTGYNGTSLYWTPLGTSWLSCIQWNLFIEDTIGTKLDVLYTMEPLYRGHHWDPAGCPL